MIWLILSIAGYCLQNVGNKDFNRRHPAGMGGTLVQTAFSLTVTALIAGLAGGARQQAPALMGLSAAFAVTYALTIVLLCAALSAGPVGPTSMLCSMGLLLPILYGVLRHGETLSWADSAGMAAMMLCAWLLSRGRESGKKARLRWMALALGSATSNGFLTLIKKNMSWSYPQADTRVFVFWGFVMAAAMVWASVGFLKLRGKDLSPWTDRRTLLSASCAGTGTAIGTLLQMVSLALLPTVIVYALSLSSVPLVLYLLSVFVYKELRVTPAGLTALLLFLTGAVLFNLPV